MMPQELTDKIQQGWISFKDDFGKCRDIDAKLDKTPHSKLIRNMAFYSKLKKEMTQVRWYLW